MPDAENKGGEGSPAAVLPAAKPEGEQPKPDEAKATPPKEGKSLAELAGAQPAKEGEEEGKVPPKAKADEPDGKDKGPSVFEQMMEFKKENREMKRMLRDEVIPTMKALQAQSKGGAPLEKDDIAQIAEKWNMDPEFVKEFSTMLSKKSEKEFEDKYLADIKDLKRAEPEKPKGKVDPARIDAAIDQEYERIVKDNPELGKVANKDFVKKFVKSDPENLNRRMEDIIEEIYGNAVPPKPGMEGYRSSGNGHQEEVDYTRMTDEDHVRVAESREKGGKEFKDYQENLIDRLTKRSRHARS